MQHGLVVVTTVLGGCSFIYNPSNINGDARTVDVETVADVDPTMLHLDYAYPATVYEGTGDGNSRPAVVVVRGEQIAPNAVVTVVPKTGAPSQITVNGVMIAPDHNWIAISITAPVDKMQDETTAMHVAAPVPLVITVDNGNGTVMSLPDSALTLQFLDQLITPITAPVDPMKRYSMIDIAALDTLPQGIGRVQLKSMSSIKFESGIVADASKANAGPGGCQGSTSSGNAGATSSNVDGAPCNSGKSVGAGTAGMAGGYGGDPQISIFANATAGGGGSGGGLLANGLGGGNGGGGAGMISLEAGGDVSLVGIHAVGGDAVNGGLAGSGGGGAGGTVLLRSGGTLSISGAIVLDGGGVGTAGEAGHLRIDAAHGGAASNVSNMYVGPMFQVVPYFSLDQKTTAITLAGAAGDNTTTGQAYDKDSKTLDNSSFDVRFDGTGLATPTINLSPGYNRLCAIVPNGNVIQHPEAGNCAEIVYLPGGHS